MTAQHDTTDNVLMTRFQCHLDEGAFEQLVLTHTGPAKAVANRFLHDHALAEDAVQEAFVRVVKQRDQFIPSYAFSSWFYTILRRVCIAMLRKMKRHQHLVEQLSHTPCTHSAEKSRSDDLSLLNV